MTSLLADVSDAAARLGQEAGWELEATALTSAGAALAAATDFLLDRGPEDSLAGATPYLRLVGFTLGGWLMARSALVCLHTPELGLDEVFRKAKLATTRFYLGQILPQAAALLPAVTAGAGILFEIEP